MYACTYVVYAIYVLYEMRVVYVLYVMYFKYVCYVSTDWEALSPETVTHAYAQAMVQAASRPTVISDV